MSEGFGDEQALRMRDRADVGMSTMLRFRHMGWDVVTAAWTAGAKDDSRTLVCYGWVNENAFYRVVFDVPFEVFLDRIGKGGIIDLGSAR